jgi:hypothetical protein
VLPLLLLPVPAPLCSLRAALLLWGEPPARPAWLARAWAACPPCRTRFTDEEVMRSFVSTSDGPFPRPAAGSSPVLLRPGSQPLKAPPRGAWVVRACESGCASHIRHPTSRIDANRRWWAALTPQRSCTPKQGTEGVSKLGSGTVYTRSNSHPYILSWIWRSAQGGACHRR